MTIRCPVCADATPLKYEIGTKIAPTGWALTFADFEQLFSEASDRKRLAEMIERWYGCQVIVVNQRVQFKMPDGSLLIREYLHDAIQADPEKQYQLYQAAMDQWR